MPQNKPPLKLRAKVVSNGLASVFSYPSYLLIAFISALVGLGTALWSLNLELLSFVLFESGVDTGLKIEFFFSIYQSLFSEVGSLQSLLLAIFGVLFGINIAVLIFVLKRRLKQQKSMKGGGGSMFGLVLATIGGGCAACGTSILAPLFATLGITSLPFIRNLGLAAATLGIVIIFYSLVKLSEQAASLREY
jgi:hypothetical protein